MNSIKTDRERDLASSKRALWVKWLLATTVGWAVGLVMAAEIGAGVGVGLAQWLVVRPLFPRAGWWIALTAAGWLTAWGLMFSGFLPSPDGGFLAEATIGAVFGVLVGLAQWVMLQRYGRRSTVWVAVSAIGWAVAWPGLLNVLLIGAIAGAITGVALVWIVDEQVLTI